MAGNSPAADEAHVPHPPSAADDAGANSVVLDATRPRPAATPPSEPQSEPQRRSPSPEYASARSHFSAATQSHSRSGSGNGENAGRAAAAVVDEAAPSTDGTGVSAAPARGPAAAPAELAPAGPVDTEQHTTEQHTTEQHTTEQHITVLTPPPALAAATQPQPSPPPDRIPPPASVLGLGAYAGRPREFWAFDVLDPAHLVSSFWVRPSMLLALHVVTALYLAAVLLLERFKESDLGPWWATYFTHWALAVFSLSAALAAVNTARCLPLLVSSAPRPDNSPSRTNWGSSLGLKGALPPRRRDSTQERGGAAAEQGASGGETGAAADIEHGRPAAPAGPTRSASSVSGGGGSSRCSSRSNNGGGGGTRPRGPLGAAVYALFTNVAGAKVRNRPGSSTHSNTAPDQHQQQTQPQLPASERSHHAVSGPAPGGDDLRATDQRRRNSPEAGRATSNSSRPQRQSAEGDGAGPAANTLTGFPPERAHPQARTLERLARAGLEGPLAAAATAPQRQALQQGAANAGLSELPRSSSSFSSAGSVGSAGAKSRGGSLHAGSGAATAAATGSEEAKWDALSVAHCLGLEVSVVTAMFVTLVYWVGLVGLAGESFNTRSAPNYMKHAANSGLAAMHVLAARLPLVSVHFTAFLLFLAAYCVFLWIYGEVSGVWRYGLNWTTPRGVAGEVVLVLLALLVFLLW
ncbi:hypothetical protein HXX76_001457 [Chlamydomonas incerta]|uniref:Uncharacterized protein n=1 Tax=Chlamydomonas incerta TaxID=51695 RepID=A0A836B1M6_CHLIN|nr:hypothetical protein HXX76_001457 [Chlamydomonas incerta]|eukprot:KAG2444713.1 hypothetical protein HXX76_001457 [Chlamydomonas incerta]